MVLHNPTFLWALAAASIPVLIYLLMRYRSLKVRWGANWVLEQALAQLRRKRYWDQIVLIALRCLAVAAVVLAFARPGVRSAVSSSGGAHQVLVVDASYSMLAGPRGRTRWDRGIETLKTLVKTWPRGQVWSLYVIDDRPRWLVEGAAAGGEDAARLLDSLRPAETRASVARALEAVAARWGRANIEVTVLADDQEHTWRDVRRGSLHSASIRWVHPPLSERANLAVTSVRPARERILSGHPTRVFVAVRNFSAEAVRDAEVELLVDGAFEKRRAVSLLAGQQTTVHFDVTLTKAGSHYLTARLESDALGYDNALTAGVEVADSLRVLVLCGERQQGGFDSAWRFLEVFARVQEMTDEFEAPVYEMGRLTLSPSPKRLDGAALARSDVVLLDGAMPLTAELAERLRRYVSRGGGLVLVADQNVRAETWNRLLGAAKLLPAPLGRLRTLRGGGADFRSLAPADFHAVALRSFQTPQDGDVANAAFYCWWEVGRPAEGAQVLARYDDGRPFLLAARGDLGAVLMLTAGLSGWWNNLPVREFYVPLIVRLCAEAAAGGIHRRTVAPNEPIRLRVGDPQTLRAASFFAAGREPVGLTPVGAVVSASGPASSQRCSILLSRAGAAARRVWYGVQGPRVDSDLAPLPAERRRGLTEQLGLVEVADWPALAEALRAAGGTRPWHAWVLLAAIVLLTAEKLIERRFV